MEEKFLQKFFPQPRYIKTKSKISIFCQGEDEALCAAWKRFKAILRRCPNHGFEEIAQLNIFHNGLRPDTKMISDAAAGGTMMSMDVEQAKRIIDALASTNYQAQYDRQSVQKKGVFELNITDAILAQNKILTQQMEALTQQMAKLPQQLRAVQSTQPVTHQNLPVCCEFCGGIHFNGNCLQQNVGGGEVQYMGIPGRQAGQQVNYPNNPPQGWRNNTNQNWGWKQ